MKKKVCISFDYTEDKHYRYLLQAWDKNSNFDFDMSDKTPDEIDSNSYSRIKAVLTAKITQTDCLLVIVGAKTNTRHPRSTEIGEKNWQIWEIEKAKELGKKIVAVKIKATYDSPAELKNIGATWALSFSQDSIIKALS